MTDQVCREPHFGRAFFLARRGGMKMTGFLFCAFAFFFIYNGLILILVSAEGGREGGRKENNIRILGRFFLFWRFRVFVSLFREGG